MPDFQIKTKTVQQQKLYVQPPKIGIARYRASKTTSQPTTPRPVEAHPATTVNSESDPIPNLLNQADALLDSLKKTLADTRDLISLIKRNQKQR